MTPAPQGGVPLAALLRSLSARVAGVCRRAGVRLGTQRAEELRGSKHPPGKISKQNAGPLQFLGMSGEGEDKDGSSSAHFGFGVTG